MALIKSHNTAALIREAIVLDLGDLGQQAAKLQSASEAKARQIVTDAQTEAARIIEDAKNKGFGEGKAQGLEAGRAEGRKLGQAEAIQTASARLNQLEKTFGSAIQQWESQRIALEREGPQRVLDFALKLSEKVVHRVIKVDPTVVVDQVASALAHVLQQVDVTVKVAPADHEAMNEAMPQLTAEFAHLKHIRVVDDPAVEPGGCVVSYGQGQIDATIATQLHRVAELMLPTETKAAE
jgi:flagellar assembly protein FliH